MYLITPISWLVAILWPLVWRTLSEALWRIRWRRFAKLAHRLSIWGTLVLWLALILQGALGRDELRFFIISHEVP